MSPLQRQKQGGNTHFSGDFMVGKLGIDEIELRGGILL
jgi:hypothetical protein